MPTPGEVEATEAKGRDQGIFIPVRYFNYLKLSVDSSLRALNTFSLSTFSFPAAALSSEGREYSSSINQGLDG